MTEFAASCFTSSWSSMDQIEVDPFASTIEVEMSCHRRIKPGQLVFKGQDTPFLDPWASTRPLTPLDHNVPQWFQRRKLALVPENIYSPDEGPCSLIQDTTLQSVQVEQRDSFATRPSRPALKRARSNVDMAGNVSRDALMLEQLSSCGQVVDELMKLPAVQSLLTRKRKADMADDMLAMDDMRTSWKRRNVRMDSCVSDSGSDSSNGHASSRCGNGPLTAADFCSWNFGFELHLTAGWC